MPSTSHDFVQPVFRLPTHPVGGAPPFQLTPPVVELWRGLRQPNGEQSWRPVMPTYRRACSRSTRYACFGGNPSKPIYGYCAGRDTPKSLRGPHFAESR